MKNRAKVDKRPTASLSELRELASNEIDRLIAFLDAIDDFADEREEAVDDVPCDGDELDADDSDNEPSLGWLGTISQNQGTWAGNDDREAGIGARPPQNRTRIDGPQVSVENSYRRFVHGLTPAQREAWKKRQPRNVIPSANDVVLR